MDRLIELQNFALNDTEMLKTNEKSENS